MTVENQTRPRLRFSLANLLATVGIWGILFAAWRAWETRPLPLDKAPLVKQGMTHEEVDQLIGAAEAGAGGMYRWRNSYSDGRHTAAIEFVEGRVVEVWFDGNLISPPEPPNYVWRNMIAAQSRVDVVNDR